MYSSGCLLVTILLLLIGCQSEEPKYEATVVSIFVSKSELPINLEVIKPALELAEQDVNRRYNNIRIKVVFRNASNECSANFAGVFAAEEYYLRSATAFVGPACSLALDPVARMAAYWNLPVYTAGGTDVMLSQKHIYKTLTRLSFTLDRVCNFMLLILREFKFHHLTLIADETEIQDTIVKNSMKEALKSVDSYEIYMTIKEFDRKGKVEPDYKKILEEASKTARVFIFICSGTLLRKILLQAFDLGMNNGEYTFFFLELVKSNKDGGNVGWYQEGDRRNRDARQIFEALMIISVRVPISPNYRMFVNRVATKVSEEYGLAADEDAVNPIVGAFYDCVQIYAYVLNQTIHAGFSPTDGHTMIRMLWNNTFHGDQLFGMTGDIHINENGDREADYTLNDMDPETGIIRPIATYYGARRVYEVNKGIDIHWPSNKEDPPPDVPYCGFQGLAAHCIVTEPFPVSASIGIVCGVLVIIVAIIGAFLRRHLSYENKLADMWWIVRWDDIVFPEIRAGMKSGMSLTHSETDTTSFKSRPSTSNMSTFKALNAMGFIVGTYKGVKVAIKPLNIKKLILNRQVYIELKMLRELTHENLVTIIGVCADEPNVSVLTVLCARGTLRDVLNNEKFKIDWMFRYAIITDIIEGLNYVHSSILEYHGRLRSTNCFIDGRFMVKLSDYGLNSIYEQIQPDDDFNIRELFWTAPEHLRARQPLMSGSKKGDVYSFAIILQEIVNRCEPFEATERLGRSAQILEPEEILDRLKMGTVPLFRPEVAQDECPEDVMALMKQCWVEKPENRPAVDVIKTSLKKITKGVSNKNFLDNLLNRMEQYSNNLESIVEEKTQSLTEEKAKTERILYQLLPKFVADELKAGRHVQPESYESVTIFFSDIVGFTSLSAESTPMQLDTLPLRNPINVINRHMRFQTLQHLARGMLGEWAISPTCWKDTVNSDFVSVVDLLNDLYTMFDATIDTYDAYKVETIGDAYLVASGLPQRNGHEHAREIARLSLSLVRNIEGFRIRHLPQKRLKLRIGMHSGSCVAGVVGLKMPKYCLFGDTVNTASRMESTGEGLKIHVSPQAKAILDLFGTFTLVPRGEIEVKGKGLMNTFWLVGENDMILRSP